MIPLFGLKRLLCIFLQSVYHACFDLSSDEGSGGYCPPPIPGFPGDSNLYMFYRNKNRCRSSDRLCLQLRLVRAYQRSGATQESFTTASCDPLQIGLPTEANVLQLSKLDEIWGAQNTMLIVETNNSPQADSYSSTGNYNPQN